MKLPRDLSGDDLRKALEKVGFAMTRRRGSHIIMRRELPRARVVVPNHKRVRAGTLRQILHEAGLTTEQLRELL